MKRTARIVGAIIGLIALSLPLETAAVSAADGSSSAVIIFDDTAHQAQLIIPTPACPVSQPDCQWKFFLNEPKLSVDVATVYGTAGTLTIDYPAQFLRRNPSRCLRGPRGWPRGIPAPHRGLHSSPDHRSYPDHRAAASSGQLSGHHPANGAGLGVGDNGHTTGGTRRMPRPRSVARPLSPPWRQLMQRLLNCPSPEQTSSPSCS